MADAPVLNKSEPVTNRFDISWNWVVLMRDWEAKFAENERLADMNDASAAHEASCIAAFDAYVAAENKLLAAPAPDLRAVAWKLERGVLEWAFSPAAEPERIATIRSVLADIERLAD